MVQLSVASGNGVVSSPRSLIFYALGEHGGICHSSLPRCVSVSCSLSGSPIRCNTQNGLMNSTRIKSEPGGKWSNAHLRTLEDVDIRRKPSPRLWSNAKFFSKRLRKFSLQSALNDFGAFMKKNIKTVVLTTSMSVALGSCYLVFRLMSIPSPKLVPYSDLVTNLQNGSVTKVLFEEGSRRIYFNTECKSDETPMTDDKKVSPEKVQSESMAGEVARNGFEQKFPIKGFNFFKRSVPRSTPSPVWKFSTRKIDHDERFLLTLMREKGTSYSSAPQSPLMSIRGIMITVLTLWIPLTPLMWLLYRQLNSANNPARKRHPDLEVVNFNDVEGVDSAKTELLEIVMCLRGATDYDKLGAKLPRGVLLIGPPGTGKTLLARAVAGEAGVPFFSVSASEFVELFVGRGAARIRDLFRVARKCSPSIVFIDELDAVGGKRGRSFNDERDQTLNQLLTEMDGFETDSKVVVIAATNRPEALDSALCRPGRFSRKVLVGEPDEEGRRKILAVHLKEVPLEEDKALMCSLVASLTQGLVGADLANIVNEAALLAARRGGQVVSREDIMEAIERAKFGIVNSKSQGSSFLAKELGKLFPWMPALTGKNIASSDQMEGPTGYQTLS